MGIKYKLKKGDPVVVISGKDKTPKAGSGNSKVKNSTVLQVDRTSGKVVVEGVNLVKRHTRPGPGSPEGGIIDKFMPVDISNVMYYCSKCNKGVRLGKRILQDGTRVRYCKSCSEIIDKK